MSESEIIIYRTDDERVKIDVRVEDETVWITQAQMAELFETSKQNISLHINNAFNEGELKPEAVVKESLTTAADGKNYNTKFYNLDVIISVGYRVKSLRGTQFRQWATKRLNEYIRKGFTLDDERLKNGGGRYFRELLQRIRDIRASERNFYQQVTDIYATAVDYDPKAEITRDFFATVQNKLHFAAHKHTAAEVVYERVDNRKPHVGMTNFKGDYVTKADVRVAKNYLGEKELQVLNLLVSSFLDYAELQALEERSMTMKNWIDELDLQIVSNRRELLKGKGKVTHKEAVEKAEAEFETYRAREMKNLVSDFDKAMKTIGKPATDGGKRKTSSGKK
ncbi:MAG: virulence RhuM family protein [Kiritimatiellaeota bacterium]|nr:virulence RhuM family protein [Kiritimatiellota bacterium]